MIQQRFVSAIEAPEARSDPAWWFIFQGDRLLVEEYGSGAEIPSVLDLVDLGLESIRSLYLGSFDGRDCFTAELAEDAPLPDGMAAHGLRGLFGRLSDDQFALAGRAVQILAWDRTHRFCGQCGTATQQMAGERAKECPHCGLRVYPRISPAVIVLVSRGSDLLLVRGHNFPEAFYGLVAGFVDPGESLEEAVAREIHEEVGLTVDHIRYFGSQPWPYPHQLMVGFNATWAGGEIHVQPSELADAAWFTPETLPRIPPKLSIARRLIDAFLAG